MLATEVVKNLELNERDRESDYQKPQHLFYIRVAKKESSRSFTNGDLE